MKPLFNTCSKHPLSIPQAMLDASSVPCSIDARGWLCGLRTTDFGLRSSDSVLRFAVFGFRFSITTAKLSLARLLSDRFADVDHDEPQVENPKPNPVKVSLI